MKLVFKGQLMQTILKEIERRIEQAQAVKIKDAANIYRPEEYDSIIELRTLHDIKRFINKQLKDKDRIKCETTT